MKKLHREPAHCGAVMACGAACVSWDHKPGEPTSVDRLVAAIARLAKRVCSWHSNQAAESPASGKSEPATASGSTATSRQALKESAA